MIRVPGFCEPLVCADVWKRVEQLRGARGAASRSARAAARGPDKHIAPLVPGVALKYPLSGLVVCGLCGLSMAPSSSPEYTTKGTGETRRYTAYHCGRAADRICANTTRVPEAWLRDAVLGLVRDRLLPTGGSPWTAARLEELVWFAPLLAHIQGELDRRADDRTDRRPALASEITRLEQQIAGWKLSLGNPGLDPEIRGALETDLGTALGRARALKAELATVSATATDARLLADPAAVAERLNRFTEVLAFDNPSRLNLELALHIDAIRCFPDGRVAVRTCKLGALTPVAEVMVTSGETPAPVPAHDTSRGGTPRKRSIRRQQTEDAGPALREAAHRAADVNRFAGLGPEWFWEDAFRVPEPTCWSKENAAAVARARAGGRTHEQLADEFGVSVPTIQKALRLAATSDPELAQLPRKMPRARWQDSHADEVWALRQSGRSMRELSAHFEVSEPLIRAALGIVAGRSTDPTPPVQSPSDPGGAENNAPPPQ